MSYYGYKGGVVDASVNMEVIIVNIALDMACVGLSKYALNISLNPASSSGEFERAERWCLNCLDPHRGVCRCYRRRSRSWRELVRRRHMSHHGLATDGVSMVSSIADESD